MQPLAELYVFIPKMYICTAFRMICTVLFFLFHNAIFVRILFSNHMRIHFFVLPAVLSGLAAATLHADNIAMRYMDTSDGLTSNCVSAIYQDPRGFIWIGTRNGLNVYNGNEFITYVNGKYSDDRPLGNDVKQIAGDGENNVFIADNRGVARFDIRKAEFSSIYDNSRGRALYYSDALYYANDDTVFRYDGEESQSIVSVPGSLICSICVQNDSVLVGTETAGLFIYDMKTKVMSSPGAAGHIYDIFHDSRGNYWVTDYSGGGLYCLSSSGIRHFDVSEASGYLASNRTHKCF